MRRSLTSVMLLIFLASASYGQTITLPKEVTGYPGSFIEVPATTDSEIVKWVSITSGLNVFPTDLLKNTKTAVVTSPFPGRYELLAYTAKDNVPSDPAKTIIIIEKSPGPGPSPPNPPNPPNPPDPPDPPDPVLSELATKVRNSARKIGNKPEANQLALHYGSVISAISAGAYDSLAFTDARKRIVTDVLEMNRKVTEENEEWNEFFKNLGIAMQQLDSEGKIKTVSDIKHLFEEIKKGLEAV